MHGLAPGKLKAIRNAPLWKGTFLLPHRHHVPGYSRKKMNRKRYQERVRQEAEQVLQRRQDEEKMSEEELKREMKRRAKDPAIFRLFLSQRGSRIVISLTDVILMACSGLVGLQAFRWGVLEWPGKALSFLEFPVDWLSGASLIAVSFSLLQAATFMGLRKAVFVHGDGDDLLSRYRFFQLLRVADRELPKAKWGKVNGFLVLFTAFLLGLVVTTATFTLTKTREDPVIIQAALKMTPFAATLVNFVAPLAEEIFFRGILFRYFFRTLGAVPAYAISSACFGLAHYSDDSIKVGYSTALGAILAFAYHASGRLGVAFAVHAANNLFVSLQVSSFNPLVQSGEERQETISRAIAMTLMSAQLVLKFAELQHRMDLRSPRPSVQLIDPRDPSGPSAYFVQRCKEVYKMDEAAKDRIYLACIKSMYGHVCEEALHLLRKQLLAKSGIEIVEKSNLGLLCGDTPEEIKAEFAQIEQLGLSEQLREAEEAYMSDLLQAFKTVSSRGERFTSKRFTDLVFTAAVLDKNQSANMVVLALENEKTVGK